MESHLTHQAVTNISTITTTTTTKTTTSVAATDDIRICLIPENDVRCDRLEENWLGLTDSKTNTMQDGGDSNSLGLHLLHPEADIRCNVSPNRPLDKAQDWLCMSVHLCVTLLLFSRSRQSSVFSGRSMGLSMQHLVFR